MEQKKELQQDMQEHKEKDKGKEDQDSVKMLELKIRQDGSGTEADSGELTLSNETIEQIFDKVFKKILTLSGRAVVGLIPFHLLKLRQWLKEGKVTEESLRKLVHDDIIGSINENQRLGNISTEDALKLKRYTGRLSRYLYQKLQGEGLGVLMEMTDESFMTDVDLFFEAYHAQEDALKEQEAALKEQKEALKEQKEALKEKDDALKEQERAAGIKLVRQICRNREKGKSPEMIAEDLIESVDVVKKSVRSGILWTENVIRRRFLRVWQNSCF